jgi:DNA replication licensing factor MCM7
MALLQYRAPVDYDAQQEAFRDFLESFKSESATEDTAAVAIDGLHIDGDGTSDEYDFMDDAENGDGTRSRRDKRSRPDKRKYVALLQDIADRVKSDILIELDDLESVRESPRPLRERYTDYFSALSMKKLWVTSII